MIKGRIELLWSEAGLCAGAICEVRMWIFSFFLWHHSHCADSTSSRPYAPRYKQKKPEISLKWDVFLEVGILLRIGHYALVYVPGEEKLEALVFLTSPRWLVLMSDFQETDTTETKMRLMWEVVRVCELSTAPDGWRINRIKVKSPPFFTEQVVIRQQEETSDAQRGDARTFPAAPQQHSSVETSFCHRVCYTAVLGQHQVQDGKIQTVPKAPGEWKKGFLCAVKKTFSFLTI